MMNISFNYIFISLIAIGTLLSSNAVVAQQSISGKIIPQVGDVNYRVENEISIAPSYLEKDGDKWNFNFLNFPYVSEDQYINLKDAKYYAYFPEADLVLQKINGEEEYFRKSEDKLYLLGRAINTSFTRSNVVIQKYAPAQLILDTSWKPGMKYNSVYKSKIKLAVTDLYSRYGAIPAGTDSILIENLTREISTIKDWAKMDIYEATEMVQHHVSDYKNKFYFKVKAKGETKWKARNINYTILPEDLQKYTFSGTATSNKYYSNDYQGVFLSYLVYDQKEVNESAKPLRITFQDKKNNIQIRKSKNSGPDVIAYPNPTYGPINFELIGVPIQDTRMEVYNIIGKKLFSKSYSRANGLIINEDVSFLQKGTYMYSFFDSKGQKLKTKRFSIIGI